MGYGRTLLGAFLENSVEGAVFGLTRLSISLRTELLAWATLPAPTNVHRRMASILAVTLNPST